MRVTCGARRPHAAPTSAMDSASRGLVVVGQVVDAEIVLRVDDHHGRARALRPASQVSSLNRVAMQLAEPRAAPHEHRRRHHQMHRDHDRREQRRPRETAGVSNRVDQLAPRRAPRRSSSARAAARTARSPSAEPCRAPPGNHPEPRRSIRHARRTPHRHRAETTVAPHLQHRWRLGQKRRRDAQHQQRAISTVEMRPKPLHVAERIEIRREPATP